MLESASGGVSGLGGSAPGGYLLTGGSLLWGVSAPGGGSVSYLENSWSYKFRKKVGNKRIIWMLHQPILIPFTITRWQKQRYVISVMYLWCVHTARHWHRHWDQDRYNHYGAQCSGGSRIFPRGGANSQKCYYFSIFCRKLHENERIWTPRGGRASLAPPLGSANAMGICDDVCLCIVWTPPQNSVQPIFYRSQCLCRWSGSVNAPLCAKTCNI